MALQHAVLLIDHQNAELLQFNSNEMEVQRIRSHSQHRLHNHHTRQPTGDVRTDHEFFAEVCDAIADISQVLVAGGHTSQSDFRHYVEKHRPHLAKQISGWETVDHPSENQLMTLAKKHFTKAGRMAGTTPIK